MRTGGIDQRILMDFRDAVDHVRKTAWAVQEWQERQITHHDPQTLLPLLTSERIRRAAQLGNAIVSDLMTQEVTRETPGVDKLFDAVQRMHRLLDDLLNRAERPTPPRESRDLGLLHEEENLPIRAYLAVAGV